MTHSTARQRLALILALIVLTVLAAGCARTERAPSLEVKNRYLVVSIEAPGDWAKKHTFSIDWQGKTVTLPVVFRVAGPADKFKLGAGPEIMKYLQIGNKEIPVTAQPDTPFRVGNELGFGMVPENASSGNAVAFSLASWVAVSPPDYPGPSHPTAGRAELERAGNLVAQRLQELLAAGRVIDVEP
jgi:hypothetical protein